jgi:hypothetical protein
MFKGIGTHVTIAESADVYGKMCVNLAALDGRQRTAIRKAQAWCEAIRASTAC